MTPPPPATPVERLLAILEFFRRGVAAKAAKEDRPRQAILCLLWSRIGRVAQRFARLAARIPAGAPPRPHTTRPRLGHPPAPPRAPS
ncbi:MAG: hypothetical protein ACP5NI_09775, partial [Acetobacteraceae bacterium]